MLVNKHALYMLADDMYALSAYILSPFVDLNLPEGPSLS